MELVYHSWKTVAAYQAFLHLNAIKISIELVCCRGWIHFLTTIYILWQLSKMDGHYATLKILHLETLG
jgi:hypothetical protein